MEFNVDTVIELIKNNQNPIDWISKAREEHKTLKSLVTGEGFTDTLLKIEGIEDSKKAQARKKYAKDIRDLCHRVMNKRNNVFEANGGSEHIDISNKTILDKFQYYNQNFKSNKSIFEYLSEYYFQLVDIDPNGVILLEYEKDDENDYEIEPCYVSIKNIRNYEDDGQQLDWLLFEPKDIEESSSKMWRVVDDRTDWTIIENAGVFIVDLENTFEHPFGQVPALILSNKEKVGCETRFSPIEPITELLKDYSRDKSILTIYKFLNGFPIHWRFVSECKSCKGTGKRGDESCSSCNGKGILSKGDVTDMVTLPVPRPDQPNIAPDIAGYISPDLKTWEKYEETLVDTENTIYDTIWGTDVVKNLNLTQKTATQTYIDVQPINNVLNDFSNVVEYMHNTFANWIINFVDPVKKKEEVLYSITYGRRYILESPDVILDRYQKSKDKGDNNTILDKILEEYILSKYKRDPKMQSIMLKKANIEPYVHIDIITVSKIFGNEQAQKKVLFQKFWETADTSKTTEQLNVEFLNYFNNEKVQIVPTTIS